MIHVIRNEEEVIAVLQGDLSGNLDIIMNELFEDLGKRSPAPPTDYTDESYQEYYKRYAAFLNAYLPEPKDNPSYADVLVAQLVSDHKLVKMDFQSHYCEY